MILSPTRLKNQTVQIFSEFKTVSIENEQHGWNMVLFAEKKIVAIRKHKIWSK